MKLFNYLINQTQTFLFTITINLYDLQEKKKGHFLTIYRHCNGIWMQRQKALIIINRISFSL